MLLPHDTPNWASSDVVSQFLPWMQSNMRADHFSPVAHLRKSITCAY